MNIKNKPPKIRMGKEERKNSIATAAVKVFSQKGFHGTTVKDIAMAAGVSEALLYDHFTSKEDIYLSLDKYMDNRLTLIRDEFANKEPGGKALIELVYCMSMMILSRRYGDLKLRITFDRLFAYSILENTNIAKYNFKMYAQELGELWEKYIKSAKQKNEIKNINRKKNSMWFVHHLAMGINFLDLSDERLYPYTGKHDELIEEAILFVLHGLELKDEVIKKYYKPAVIKKENRKFLNKFFNSI